MHIGSALAAADAGALRDIRAFQSDTAEIIAAPAPLRARIALHTVAALLVTAIVGMAIVPIDRTVKARGQIVSQAPTIVVQPMDLAVVREVAVREGQIVRKGDLLARLDSTFSAADVTRLRQEEGSLAAEVARLEAEMAGRAYSPGTDDPFGAVQLAVHGARMAAELAAKAHYDEKVASTQAGLDRARRDLAYYRERLTLFEEVESMRTILEQKNVGSRLSSLVAVDGRIEMERNVATADGAIRSGEHELEALKAERTVYLRQREAERAQQLADKRLALGRAREELSKALRRQDLVDLRAVEDAIVLQVGAISVGSVVQPAEKMMTLVPVDTATEVVAEIDASDQGFVKAGDEVELKLDAWPFVEHGTAHGVVRSISADSFTPKDQRGARTFFVARIDVTGLDDLRRVPADFRLVPGMPLTADIVVGSRTIMDYLLDGALKDLDEGLTEP